MGILSGMGNRLVKRAFRYRFHPTSVQAENLEKTFGCVR
ncbi:hypothetical protein FRACA_210026 [Frankia canadensis]|uniref:Transposase putative helix-turn-helix domain-containing protein n=1 Tax=Frankia canadensis TaxID=1836972 RepID=A0A2I2KQJ3_9ACTN|nr:hypothetical protein FRACA_210026 [Frankia canadensis]SOU55231.1 hypothetical protein FRACA_210026 [Frankia canadensis]